MSADRARIIDYLPEIYRGFLPAFFENPIERESLADCSRCPMLAEHRGFSIKPEEVFSPLTKCCTFHPTTPNYLAGCLLESNDPEYEAGKSRLIARMKRRVEVTPLGINPPKKYLFLYEKARRRAFGKAVSMLCPYYDETKGGCAVWIARSDACSTFFCDSVAGLRGRRFWRKLRTYLQVTQRNLAVFALDKLGIDAGPILEHLKKGEDLGPDDLDERISDEDYSRLWGDYEGRERELFGEAYGIVSRMGRNEFASLSSRDQVSLAALERLWKAARDTVVPPLLAVNPALTYRETGDGRSLISSPEGEFEASAFVVELLGLFDGHRSTSQIARYAREVLDVELDDNYLTTLWESKILVDARARDSE